MNIKTPRRPSRRPLKTDPGRAALLALYDADPRAFAVRLLHLCLQAESQKGLRPYYGIAAQTLRNDPRPGWRFRLALERFVVLGPSREAVPLLIEAYTKAGKSLADPNRGTLAETLGQDYFDMARKLPACTLQWRALMKEAAHWLEIASKWFDKHPTFDANDRDDEARRYAALAWRALDAKTPDEVRELLRRDANGNA